MSSCKSLELARRNHQKKRLEKLVKILGVDSSYSTIDTIINESEIEISFPAFTVDTIMEYQIDTILVASQDGVKTEIKIMTDSVWFETHIFERDTIIQLKDTFIYKEVIKTVNTTPEKRENVWKWWHYLLTGAVVGLIITAAGLRLAK
jgi:predicted transcriptional regulator